MFKPTFSAALYLLLVFLSGAVVGTVAYRAYTMNTASAGAPARKRDPEEFRKHYVQDMRTRLKLDGQQVAQLEQILDQTREEFHQMNAKMRAEGGAIQNHQVEKINTMLREDQRPLYEKFRAEREAERKRRQAEKGDFKK
jgi:uncharacterized membrane protein